MVLPSVENNPVLLLRFTPKASRKLIASVVERLSQASISVAQSEGYGDGADRNAAVVLGITTSQNRLEHEAEVIKILKPSRTQNDQIPIVMEYFTIESRENFINIEDWHLCFNKDLAKHLPNIDWNDYDSDRLFTASDRALLTLSILNAIPVLHKDQEFSDLSNVFDALQIKYCAEDRFHSFSMIQVLKSNGFLDVVCPMHVSHIKNKILSETISMKNAMPIQSIRNYYGEGVAFYFAWMDFMTKWFTIPGTLGLAVFFIRKARGDTVDNCDFTPFFGLVTFVWAVLCDRFWERTESRMSYLWGTYASSYRDRVSFGQRPSFYGEMRQSPVTGRLEKYYPWYKRLFKFAISSTVTVVLLSIATFVMVISMNVQGYISSKDLEQWGEENHPLYFPWFASLAEKGKVFDANSPWKSFIPVVLRAALIQLMNKQYRYVAELLTEWENHETNVDFDNSVVLKRVLFEAFDAYIILFYLAIYERNIHLLRLELVGAFNVDTFRRLIIECVLPFVLQNLSFSDGETTKSRLGERKKNDDGKSPHDSLISRETYLDEYEQFDDYLEMIIQFGYITLFASAFPLASLIAVAANLIEYRADLWKLTRVCQRPCPTRVDSIGMWKQIMRVMVWTSALTNCLIFSITSAQMRQWLPNNYTTDEHGRTVLVPHTADETILIMFAIEHTLLLLGEVLRRCVNNVPDDVLDEVDRCKWLHEIYAQRARLRIINTPEQMHETSVNTVEVAN